VRLGRGQHRLYGRQQNAGALAFRGVPLHLYRRAAKQAVLAVISLAPEARFRARWRLNVFLGKITEAKKDHAAH